MSENILAVDPGSERSAWLLFEPAGQRVVEHGLCDNEALVRDLASGRFDGARLVIEEIECYGMAVGKDVFSTCRWSGRFEQAFGGVCELLPRRAVKLNLCHSSRAKDANVRQALLDRFGPGKARAAGRKASPGPLYGIRKDIWSALGIAVTVADRLQSAGASTPPPVSPAIP